MKRAREATVLAVGLLLAMTSAAGAATRTAVTMDVSTTFDEEPDYFTATGIAGCETGVVSDGGAHVQFTPRPGIFAGFKVFECDGSDSGLVARLNARFGEGGSVGSWTIVDAWGSLAGLRGSGSLTGDPIDNGILDHYVGTTTG